MDFCPFFVDFWPLVRFLAFDSIFVFWIDFLFFGSIFVRVLAFGSIFGRDLAFGLIFSFWIDF